MILYIGNKLVSKDKNASGIDTLSALLEQEGYEVRAVSSYAIKLFRLCSMMLNVISFRRRIKYVLIDTYSTSNFYYAYLISRLCVFLNIKYIPILRGGNLPQRLDNSPKMAASVFNNSYANVAPSNYLKTEFENRGYITIYIPNVLEIKKYEFKPRGISEPRLLYVRAFASIYNPEMAIHVLKDLIKDFPNTRLCMIGPVKDNSLDSCKELVHEFNLENSVEFTGKLSKDEWHKKAVDYNIFINTTNIDNTPVSVMEAMALGIPVVSTNVGGVPYLVKNEHTGLLVDKNNVEQMAKGVKRLITDEKLSSTIAQNARKHVESFDWDNVCKLWNNILK